MKCPNDSATLVMSERSGVEIDYCPECRGVWLDRGELDKILSRAEAEYAAAVPAAPPRYQEAAPVQPPLRDGYTSGYGDRDRDYDGRDGGYGGYRRKKKESWLSELFD
ncbi:zf-TFIIB domain-containing protein [Okibacterium endophyticum]